jgi:hypothetical protein
VECPTTGHLRDVGGVLLLLLLLGSWAQEPSSTEFYRHWSSLVNVYILDAGYLFDFPLSVNHHQRLLRFQKDIAGIIRARSTAADRDFLSAGVLGNESKRDNENEP